MEGLLIGFGVLIGCIIINAIIQGIGSILGYCQRKLGWNDTPSTKGHKGIVAAFIISCIIGVIATLFFVFIREDHYSYEVFHAPTTSEFSLEIAIALIPVIIGITFICFAIRHRYFNVTVAAIVLTIIGILPAKIQFTNLRNKKFLTPIEGGFCYMDVNGNIDETKGLMEGNYAVVERNLRYGLIDHDGNIVLPIEYDFIYYASNYDVATVELDSVASIFKNGQMILTNFQDVYPIFTEGGTTFYLIQNSGKYGVIDESKNVVLPCEYDELIRVTDVGVKPIFIASKGDLYGIIDYTGQVILPLKYNNIVDISYDESNMLKVVDGFDRYYYDISTRSFRGKMEGQATPDEMNPGAYRTYSEKIIQEVMSNSTE